MDDDHKIESGVGDKKEADMEEIEDGFEFLTIEAVDQKPESPNIDKEEIEEKNEKSPEQLPEAGDRQTKPLEGKDQENNVNDVKEGDVAEPVEPDNTWDWNSWTNWGTSVINTAASSVTTFTSQVGDGLIQVLETVESGLMTQEEDENENANPPKECPEQPITDQNIDPRVESMERMEGRANDAPLKETSPSMGGEKSWLLSSLSNVVSKTSSVVQQTTNVVVHGGLDMLESIGKKTYDVITEGDHGLKKVLEKNKERRQMPNLSLVLKEAKEIAELRTKEEESMLETKKFLYSYWFDEYQGLVQLEAFELLASQNEVRTREEYDRLPKEKLADIKKKLAELNKIYKSSGEESEDEEADHHQDFNQLVIDYAARLPAVISVQKLLQCYEAYNTWQTEYKTGKLKSEDGNELSPEDVLQKSMQFLAQMTALSIQHFHKLAQLLTKTAASPEPSHEGSAKASAAGTAQTVVDFSKVINKELSAGSSQFVTIMSKFETSDNDTISKEVSEHITTIYLETSNSTNFVQRSLKLLLPTLQVSIITSE